MNRPSPILEHESHYQLKAIMGIADFARRLQKLIAQGNQGAVDYALNNFYVAQDQICVRHEPQLSKEPEAA